MECTSQINKRSIYHTRSPRFRLICYVLLLLFQSHQTTSQVLPLSKYTRYPASGVSWLQFSLCAPFRSNFLRDNSHHQFPAQKLSVNPYCLLNAAQTLHLKFNILYNLVPSSFADQPPTTSLQTPSTQAKLAEVTFSDHSSVFPEEQLWSQFRLPLPPMSFSASLL